MTSAAETIYAPASPPGKGGVAVIRVSGTRARDSLALLLGDPAFAPQPRRSYLKKLRDPASGEIIDHGLVVYFAAPASFTGEDIVEYHIHGGMAIIHQMMAALGECDAHRMAMPGEFTRRAFENGKLDLTAAEAIADLIDAETILQKNQALSQLEGNLGALYEGWAVALTDMLAHIEADIEFPDEDLPAGILPQLLPGIAGLAQAISVHLDDNRRGERLRDGLKIAVIGAPNAGKSSLVNALARRDVAIVSAAAGTTRDVIDVHLDLAGYPVVISDTAGLRPGQVESGAQGEIEEEGMRRALQRAESADIRLLLFDASLLPDRDPQTMALAVDRALLVFNKADLCDPAVLAGLPAGAIALSAATGSGMDDLLAALEGRCAALIGKSEVPSLTRTRHREALQDCLAALGRAQSGHDLPELVAEDIRLAVRALGRVTGHVHVEDLLDVIFRDFCIGK